MDSVRKAIVSIHGTSHRNLDLNYFFKIHGSASQSTQLGTRTHISLNTKSMH
jgi:hypothetical protein